MALIDIECLSGHVTTVHRSIHDWPQTPPCPECSAKTAQVHLPKSAQWNPDPVIVYQAPDGTMRFPGAKDGLSNASYEKKGFKRIEIRGAAEMRQFEKHMNRHERSRMERALENRQAMKEHRESVLRSALRDQMRTMSRAGRDLARAAMRTNDNKPRERVKDANFVSEIYSMDRSSRDEGRSSDGRRFRD